MDFPINEDVELGQLRDYFSPKEELNVADHLRSSLFGWQAFLTK